MEGQREKIKAALIFCINIGVSLLFLFFVYRLWERDFRIPIVYNGGDGVGALITIRKAIEGKGFFDFDFFSAPYGEALYSQDYFFPYLIVKLITLFTSDVGIAANLFWISTYVLTAISMYIFLKRLGCSWTTILVGSTLYNFLPYHYFRLEHFWLMGCYTIPLVGYMVLEILEERIGETSSRQKKIKWLLRFVFALLIGLNGLYYAVFSMMVLTIALFYSLVYKKRYQSIKQYLTDCFGIVLPIIVLYAMPIVLWGTKELSNISSDRNISQINSYGLNLALLFLPIPGHRLQALSDFTEYCYEHMYIYTENFTESLGIVMSVGVIVAVLFAFKKACSERCQERIRDFGILILVIFIVATIGGLDNFIAIFISASIRCYNRLSIFIALFAIGVVCLLLDKVRLFFQKRKRHYFFWGICAAVTIIGVLDVTSPNFSVYETYDVYKRDYVYPYSTIEQEYDNDVDFFEKINKQLDEEKMLFIAPYNADITKFGEEGYFSRLKIYMLQPEIRISTSLYDKKYEEWWMKISEADMEIQMKIMAVLGYSGILIDESSFSGQNDIDSYIESIADYVDENSKIISANNNLSFYSIKEWKNEFLSQYSRENVEKWREDIFFYVHSEYGIVNLDELHGLDEDNVVKIGNTQFGPYYSLDKGDYQVVLYGSNLANVDVKVTADSGKEQISITDMQVSDDYICYGFSLDQTCHDIEFVAEGSQDFKVHDYYYAKKMSEDFNLWRLLQIKKELRDEFGLGSYEKELPLEIFKIKGKGKVTKDAIILSGNSVQYGPYLYLGQGNYQVSIKGEGLADAKYRVTAQTGKENVKCNIVEQSDTVLTYEFRLHEPMSEVEFLVESGNDDIYIEEYVLSYQEN
ncbi:MAG: hypothetical protein PUB98_06700 [Clostridiales bacterium]|nr:hypothetical protein [Clostridiales bacterium]